MSKGNPFELTASEWSAWYEFKSYGGESWFRRERKIFEGNYLKETVYQTTNKLSEKELNELKARAANTKTLKIKWLTQKNYE